MYTPLASVTGGKLGLKLRVRVAHVWLVPDKEHPEVITFMNMILVDEKSGKMHATVRRHLVPKIREMVEEGSTYVLENVMVGFNDEGRFKLTPHKYKLNMMQSSKFTKIHATNIPMNVFDFMSFKSILESNTEDKITDVIGHIVEKDNLRHTDNHGRRNKVIDLTLEDLENNRLRCSLWGEFAERVDSYFGDHEMSSQVILILQFCKLRKYMGEMTISNNFFGSKLILNGNLPEVEDYKTRMNSGEVELTQGVSQMSGYNSVPLADDLLNIKMMSIENLVESTEACVGAVLATICEIDPDAEWYFRSCAKCFSLVTIVDGKLCCKKCDECKSAMLRFKLHVIVMDHTGSTTFVLFDRIVTEFIGRSVQDLIDTNTNTQGEYPSDFNTLLDKQVLFKIEVSKGNVYNKWRNYGVKKATTDVEIINRFKKANNIEDLKDAESSQKHVAEVNDVVNLDQFEHVDSSGNTIVGETPSNKSSVKRSSDSVNSIDNAVHEVGEISTTKPRRSIRVKVEKVD